MAFPGSAETDLLLALEDAAAGGGAWTDFLARLAGLSGARFAALLVRPHGTDRVTDIATATPAGLPAVTDGAGLRVLLSERMRPERVYAEDELGDLLDAGGETPAASVLDRLGMVSTRAIRIAEPAAGSLTLGIFGARPFDAADGAVLRRLFPYLRAAARIAARIRREQGRAAVTTTLMAPGILAWFLLDRTGMVIERWTALGGLPDAVRILGGAQGDRLAFAGPAAGPALTAILDGLAVRSDAADRALWITHEPPLHLRIARAPQGLAVGTGAPLALATLHGDRGAGTGGAGLLVDLYGLMPSEARFAIALATGGGIAAAAHTLGLSTETARNYSKKVFAKTGTRGQADLTRLILARGLASPPT